MRRLLALLCMVVFLFGTALCEDTQALPPEDTIIEEVSEQEQVPSEAPILEEPIPEVEEDPPIESPPEEESSIELEQEEPAQQPEELEEPVEEPVTEEEEIPPTEELVESEDEETSETPTEVQPREDIQISEEVLTTPMPEPEEPEVDEPIEPAPEEEEEIIESEEVIVPEEIVEIPDGDWGYVDPELIPREVHISFLTEPRYFGDEAVLIITLVNFRSDDRYTIHWQYCEDASAAEPQWQDIEGENSRTYSFIVDKTNYLYGYRALVILEDE